ncbi:MAG: efflux RND transporter periplasmic adaptor subunit [Proteobacteria bacterium]|nr:efflux RND transporter periplasmic adaptor subunit [Pseudomonadota bacterium]MDA1310282.1 efflux RND transporter periplasmic adaptor subunit [Pseudomonadota bacterium]
MALAPKKRGALKWAALLTVVGMLGFSSYEFFYWYTHVYEFDARIRTDLTRISSRVNGTIEAIEVAEGDRVSAGDLLVSMKAGAVRQRIAALKADLLGATARHAKLSAQKHALEADLDAKVATKRELVRALEVERQALIDRHTLATKKLKRTVFLVSKNLTSQQVLEDSQDRVLELSGKLNVASAKVKVAGREVAEIEAGRADIAVLDEEIKISGIDSIRLNAQIKEQEVDLAERFIRSPIDGVIDRIFKNKGEYVEDADELLLMHDPKNIWIEANIGEDEIRLVRVGQAVKVDLDAYPYNTFKGEVAAIGGVTVADLKLAGNDATAKSLKSTQKIPVKITLLDPPPITAPGMLVEVNIQVRDQVALP